MRALMVVVVLMGCGRIGFDGRGGASGDDDDDAPSTAVRLELLAGDIGGLGSVDGVGTAARFFEPRGLARDSLGTLYIADTFNNTIRKVSATGVVTTLAGSPGLAGADDGTGSAARFSFPRGIAVDDAGNVFVADQENHTIRKITAAGVVTTFAGKPGTPGSDDGQGTAARFHSPTAVAIDGGGNVYVTDTLNYTVRKISSAGLVTTLAGTAGQGDPVDGTGPAARFGDLEGVTVDRTGGDLYVTEGINDTIRRITPAGVVTTYAGKLDEIGGADGDRRNARFNTPYGITIDRDDNLYIGDGTNFTIRKITPAGIVTTLAGAIGAPGSQDGPGDAATFTEAFGLAADDQGNVYVADSHSETIRRIAPDRVVTTIAGRTGLTGSTDATGATARFAHPAGVTVDPAGTAYVVDELNFTIRKIRRRASRPRSRDLRATRRAARTASGRPRGFSSRATPRSITTTTSTSRSCARSAR